MFKIFLLVQCMILLCTCTAHKDKSGEKPPGRYQFAGTVVYQEIEGGFYGIQGDDGERYDPVNLPADLRIDGLRVRVIADPLPASHTIRMWGKLIKIIDIERNSIPDND